MGSLPVLASPKRSFARSVKAFDFYPKIDNEHAVKTNSGAAVSLISGVIIFFLFASELVDFFSATTIENIVVDSTRGEKLEVFFNLTFPNLPCTDAHLDVMDSAGDQQVNVFDDMTKVRLAADGSWMGTPMTDKRFLEFEELEKKAEEQQKKESSEQMQNPQPLHSKEHGVGCILAGSLKLNKVAGNFHIALGHSRISHSKHVHQFSPEEAAAFNSSHSIEFLSFGKSYPGQVNPLNGISRGTKAGNSHYQYFIKIVPTTFYVATGQVKYNTNQYSVTHQERPIDMQHDAHKIENKIPGIFFIYDLSPFRVEVREVKKSWSVFLTSLCAIVGGVFAVSGVIDAMLHRFIKMA